MGLEFKPLRMDYFAAYGMDLLREQYEELTLNKDIIKLNIDWERYFTFENIQILKALGVWSDEQLIGYSIFFVNTHPHYKDALIALNDVIYLNKLYRRGSAGIKLIKESEKMLWALKVDKIVFHCKYDHPLADILKKMGYMDEEFSVYKIKR